MKEGDYMKVIVTGGAGFIGHHLVKYLVQLEYKVYIIDNFDDYYSPQRKRKQLESIGYRNRYQLIEANLLQEEKVHHIFQKIKPDIVVHLAALPGVSYSLENPHAYIEKNIEMTVNVLKAAGINHVKHVVFASSSSVYGDQKNVPLMEEMANGKVISPYAASKYSAESFCQAYSHIYSFQLTILRFFTVFGPFGRPDMAIGKFISKLLRNEEITLFGQGVSRDFTYVDDIVRGIELAMKRKGENEIYNLGAGHPVTMEELLLELKKFFPHMQVKQEKYRIGDVSATWADISKATKQLGFKPTVSFQEGIKRTVQWAKEYEV